VLHKQGRLTDAEFRAHEESTLRPVVEVLEKFPDYRRGRELVLAHHERMDGRGYPRGLSGGRDSTRRAHHRGRRLMGRDDLRPALPGRPRRRGWRCESCWFGGRGPAVGCRGRRRIRANVARRCEPGAGAARGSRATAAPLTRRRGWSRHQLVLRVAGCCRTRCDREPRARGRADELAARASSPNRSRMRPSRSRASGCELEWRPQKDRAAPPRRRPVRTGRRKGGRQRAGRRDRPAGARRLIDLLTGAHRLRKSLLLRKAVDRPGR